MSEPPVIGDFWNFRCRRMAEGLPAGHPLKALNETIWQSCKEVLHRITIGDPQGSPLEIKVLAVQQGTTRQHAFYDWQHLPDTFRRVQRLRSVHANLRSALTSCQADKIIGSVSVNLQELSLAQVADLCHRIADWWDLETGAFLSPFSQMAYVMRNWLEGLYGEGPIAEHPSLGAMVDIDTDLRLLLAETAKAAYKILSARLELGPRPWIGIVGEGLWAETVASVLACEGARCSRVNFLPLDHACEILFLLHTENVVTPDRAERLTCRAIVEMLPEQINPLGDAVLVQRGVTVMPDILCQSAQEIVEDWWLGGRRLPRWETALETRLAEVWDEIGERAATASCSSHDAACLLALERLAGRWQLL